LIFFCNLSYFPLEASTSTASLAIKLQQLTLSRTLQWLSSLRPLFLRPSFLIPLLLPLLLLLF